jgi:DNA repair exonuclease SbcCD ATPase subunit
MNKGQQAEAIEAYIIPLPPDLCHANLCRMPPQIMDTLDVSPGGLIWIREPEKGKTGISRVWLRCPGIQAAEMTTDTGWRIEIDPSLMEYLEIEENGRVLLETRNKENSLNIIEFHTTRNLSAEQISELKQAISNAGWPVYPRAFFAINLSGKPIDLIVATEILSPGIITPATLIEIHHIETANENDLKRQIADLETFLYQRQKEIETILMEIKQIQKDCRLLKTENTEFQKKITNLEKEKNQVINEMRSLPGQQHHLKETLTALDQEISRIQTQIDTLNNTAIQDFDLPAQKKESRHLENKVEKALKQFEKEGNHVFSIASE